MFAAVSPSSPTAYRALSKKGVSTDADRRTPQLDHDPVRFPKEFAAGCLSSENFRICEAQIALSVRLCYYRTAAYDSL